MNSLGKLKLAHRLFFAFFSCTVLTAIVGLYALGEIRKMHGQLESTYKNNLTSIRKLGEVQLRAASHSRVFSRVPALKDSIERRDAIKRADKHMDILKSAFADYRKIATTPEETP